MKVYILTIGNRLNEIIDMQRVYSTFEKAKQELNNIAKLDKGKITDTALSYFYQDKIHIATIRNYLVE